MGGFYNLLGNACRGLVPEQAQDCTILSHAPQGQLLSAPAHKYTPP